MTLRQMQRAISANLAASRSTGTLTLVQSSLSKDEELDMTVRLSLTMQRSSARQMQRRGQAPPQLLGQQCSQNWATMTALGHLPSWQSPLTLGSTAVLATQAFRFSTGRLRRALSKPSRYVGCCTISGAAELHLIMQGRPSALTGQGPG